MTLTHWPSIGKEICQLDEEFHHRCDAAHDGGTLEQIPTSLFLQSMGTSLLEQILGENRTVHFLPTTTLCNGELWSSWDYLWYLPGPNLKPMHQLAHLLPTIMNDALHSCLPATRPSECSRTSSPGLSLHFQFASLGHHHAYTYSLSLWTLNSVVSWTKLA